MSAEKLVEPEFKRWTGWLMLDIEEPDQTNLFLYATFKLLTQGRLLLSVSVLERKRLILQLLKLVGRGEGDNERTNGKVEDLIQVTKELMNQINVLNVCSISHVAQGGKSHSPQIV